VEGEKEVEEDLLALGNALHKADRPPPLPLLLLSLPPSGDNVHAHSPPGLSSDACAALCSSRRHLPPLGLARAHAHAMQLPTNTEQYTARMRQRNHHMHTDSTGTITIDNRDPDPKTKQERFIAQDL